MIVSVQEINNATIVKVELKRMLGYSGTDFQEILAISIKSTDHKGKWQHT